MSSVIRAFLCPITFVSVTGWTPRGSLGLLADMGLTSRVRPRSAQRCRGICIGTLSIGRPPGLASTRVVSFILRTPPKPKVAEVEEQLPPCTAGRGLPTLDYCADDLRRDTSPARSNA